MNSQNAAKSIGKCTISRNLNPPTNILNLYECLNTQNTKWKNEELRTNLIIFVPANTIPKTILIENLPNKSGLQVFAYFYQNASISFEFSSEKKNIGSMVGFFFHSVSFVCLLLPCDLIGFLWKLRATWQPHTIHTYAHTPYDEELFFIN